MSRVPSDLSAVDASDVRIVAVDMDGTLLNDAKELPEGLWDVVRELEQRGIEFVPASGRQYWTLRNLFAPVADGTTIIAENGALVMKDHEQVYIDQMDIDTAVEAVKRVRQVVDEGADTGIVVCCAQSAYIERGDEAFQKIVREYYNHTEVVPDLLERLEDIRGGRVEDTLLKLAQWAKSDIISLSEFTMGHAIESHQRVVSGANWADLQEKTVNKGRAIEALQRRLGVGPTQTMVFGDFNNDIEMLERADFSFAMLNASDDVHAVARYIAPSNNEAGVLSVIRELLFASK